MVGELLPEKWMKGVAVTTTCLAVMTAIAASRGAVCVAKTQLLTAIESSKWAHYQAKSIKQNMVDAQVNAFEVEVMAANAEQKALYDQKIETAKKESIRYGEEKGQVMKEAQDTNALNLAVSKKGNFFSGAVVFFQIAIMLSSVSALLKKKFMWAIGLLFGVIAIVLLGYGLAVQPVFF